MCSVAISKVSYQFWDVFLGLFNILFYCVLVVFSFFFCLFMLRICYSSLKVRKVGSGVLYRIFILRFCDIQMVLYVGKIMCWKYSFNLGQGFVVLVVDLLMSHWRCVNIVLRFMFYYGGEMFYLLRFLCIYNGQKCVLSIVLIVVPSFNLVCFEDAS